MGIDHVDYAKQVFQDGLQHAQLELMQQIDY